MIDNLELMTYNLSGRYTLTAVDSKDGGITLALLWTAVFFVNYLKR